MAVVKRPIVRPKGYSDEDFLKLLKFIKTLSRLKVYRIEHEYKKMHGVQKTK